MSEQRDMTLRAVRACALLVALAAAGCASTSPRSAVLDVPAVSPVHSGVARSAADARVNDYRGLRASRMIGVGVLDERGRMLGTIEDLVVNMRTGEVRYALVAADRSVQSAKLRAVPVRQLRSTDMNGFFTDVDPSRGVPLADAGYPADAYPVSRLIGNAVEDTDGRPLGRIADLGVDMNREQVHYAAVSFAPHVGLGTERIFAVPLTALVFASGSARRLALNARYERLAQLAAFDLAHWPAANDRRFLEAVRESFAVVFPPTAAGAAR